MTVLFLKDLDHYPTAEYDTKTTNQSFVRLVQVYKSMGVKNHAFPLILLNKNLQGIDPFDPGLTRDEINQCAVEARLNFWWWLREVGRAPARAGGKATPIRANRGNIALYWLFWNHITTMLVQIRQTGKSFGSDLLYIYLLNIRCSHTVINILTKDEILRMANMERLKEIEAELPYYLKMRKKGEVANTEEMRVSSRGNSLKILLPNSSPKMALKVGRGLTSPIMGIDEAAFLPNIEISLSAALAGGGAVRDIAEENEEPYGTIITTTAGKKDDRDGKYIHKKLMESAVWTEKFLDCEDLQELEHVIKKASKGGDTEEGGSLRVNCTFSHRQLGYTDEWVKRKVRASEAEGDAADRDFFNKWTSGTQTSPLTTENAAKVRESEREVAFTMIGKVSCYVTRWYIPEEEIPSRMVTGHYVMALDTSDAGGGDDTTMSIRDIRSGEIIAAGDYNETNLITFAEWILTWFVDYSNITLIPERKSSAPAIIDYLVMMMVARGIDPFKRIFNRVVQNADEYPERFAEINKPMYARDREVYNQFKRFFGFVTSGTGEGSRSELYGSTLQATVRYMGDKIYDKQIIDQLLGLVIRNGRVDHERGEHDDAVISWLLSAWFLLHGRNLDFYGINSREVLKANKQVKEDNSPDKVYARAEQAKLRTDIESLIQRMRHVKDAFLIKKMEHDLQNMAGKLILEETETFSVDTLIRELREQRNMNRFTSQQRNTVWRPRGY